jgi:hemolysin-activating ACP:hemolysin acyltransferase
MTTATKRRVRPRYFSEWTAFYDLPDEADALRWLAPFTHQPVFRDLASDVFAGWRIRRARAE